MSKTYKVGDVFYDKTINSYIKAVASNSEICNRGKCALYANCSHVDQCVGMFFIKVPAPKCSVGFAPESAWGINPSKETMETVMAKGERMANSIMGFNSKESIRGTVPSKVFLKNEILFSKQHPRITITASIMPIKANKFIVSLLENGLMQLSVNPKIHDSIESAEKEAERLCRLHNQEFVVLKVTASFKPQQPKKEVFA